MVNYIGNPGISTSNNNTRQDLNLSDPVIIQLFPNLTVFIFYCLLFLLFLTFAHILWDSSTDTLKQTTDSPASGIERSCHPRLPIFTIECYTNINHCCHINRRIITRHYYLEIICSSLLISIWTVSRSASEF